MVELINKRRLSGINPSPLPLQLNDFIYKNQTVKLVTYPSAARRIAFLASLS